MSNPQYNNPFKMFLALYSNFAKFDGRARRQEYWMTVLGVIIVNFLVALVFGVVGLGKIGAAVESIISLSTIIPGLAIATRRLHDTGKSGWYLLLPLIPFVGAIVLLVFLCQDSNRGANAYGSSEKYGE